MNCPHCGEEIAGASTLIQSIPERDKPEIKYNEIVKMYEQMRPIKPQEMNTECRTIIPFGIFDCVDGT